MAATEISDHTVVPTEFERIVAIHDEKHSISKPLGRSGHCSVSDETCMYVYGGFNPEGGEEITSFDTEYDPQGHLKRQVLSELWKFNYSSRTWSQIKCENPPKTAASSKMVCLHNKLLVFGGTNVPWGKEMSNDVSVCDKKGKSWENLQTQCEYFGDKPRKGYGQSLAIQSNENSDTYLYVFSGTVILFRPHYGAKIHRLSLRSLKWEELEPSGEAPMGRYRQEMVCYQDVFYIFGGGHRTGTISLESLAAYSLKDHAWLDVRTYRDPVYGYPGARLAFACVPYGQNVFIFGGWKYGLADDEVRYRDAWSLNLDNFQWKHWENQLPMALHFHTGVLGPSGHVYIYGGIQPDQQRSSEVYRLRLFVPKLSELVWDKLTHLIQDIHTLSQADLMKLGLPRHFSSRLL